MTSNRDRQQRAAARARLEREMTLRAEMAQRRRRRQAVIGGAVAAVLVIVGVVWGVIALGGSEEDKKTPAAAASKTPEACAWQKKGDPNASAQPLPPEVKDVGTPPATGEPRSGKQTMTLATSQGEIKIEVDTAKAPCTAASFTYLAGKKFFDNSICHRLVTEGIKVLQCGDPSGTGRGGPAYQYADENLPVGQRPAYPEGTVAMANAGPGTNGSQFFIVYADTELDPNYTVLGKVVSGLDVVKKVAAGGVNPDPNSQSAADGKPKTEVRIQSLTMSAPNA